MQTAMKSHIQWLYDNQLELNIPIEVIEDAEDRLEMEKQQIIDAYNNGDLRSADLYYDETYGSKGSDESKLSIASLTDEQLKQKINERTFI